MDHLTKLAIEGYICDDYLSQEEMQLIFEKIKKENKVHKRNSDLKVI